MKVYLRSTTFQMSRTLTGSTPHIGGGATDFRRSLIPLPRLVAHFSISPLYLYRHHRQDAYTAIHSFFPITFQPVMAGSATPDSESPVAILSISYSVTS